MSKRSKYDVDAKTFIEIWQTARSAQEVADKTGMPKPIVLARASSYRKKGINLKNMDRHLEKGLDVDALNALIDSLGKGPERNGGGEKEQVDKIADIIRKRSKPPEKK